MRLFFLRAAVAAAICTSSLTGCATFQARSSFSRGEKAMAQGDTDGAIQAYQEAAEREPNKPEYQAALTNARNKAAARHRDDALAAEARGDHARAEKSWNEAARYQPGNDEWKARAQLANLLARRADPVDYYRAAQKLAALRPDDPVIAATLAQAKDQAVAYHLRLAATYADAEAYAEAYKEYEVARQIAPDQAVFSSPRYQHVSARHLEALGDQKAAAGDAIGAYQAYEQAAAVKRSGALTRKMANAKRGAGPIMEQLEQAETMAKLGKWEEAADIYSPLTSRAGAPADTAQKALEARQKSAEAKAARAQAYVERGLHEKGIAELALCLEHTDGPLAALDALRATQALLEAGRPGAAAARLSSLDPGAKSLAYAPAAEVVIKAQAGAAYDKARAMADSDPAGALVAIKELEPFASKLSGYEGTVKGLTKRAFSTLLERAEAKAQGGDRVESARLVRTALEVSQPPAELAKPLRAGTEALEKGEWETAHRTFQELTQKNGRSQLARVGQNVAAVFRLVELKKDAADARSAQDATRAASAYRAILALAPGDAEAQAGIDALKVQLVEAALAAGEAHAAAGRVGAAFVYFRRVNELEPGHPVATQQLDTLRSRLQAGDAPEAFVANAQRDPALGAACPGAEKTLRDRLALYLTRTPGLGVSYLAHEAVAQVEKGERAAPAFELVPTVVACRPVAKGGALKVRWQLKLHGKVLAESVAESGFDPTSIPKDELQAGLPEGRVLGELVGGVAKAVSSGLKEHADRLKGWRALEAQEAIAKDDAEGAARWYANLVGSDSLPEEERGALRELERYVTVRFR